MNFFLIANNDSITDKTINDLPINEEDIIILYNNQMPLKWKKIKEHENKWLFLRKKQGGFWGEKTLSKNKNLYKKIFLTTYKEIEEYLLLDMNNKYKHNFNKCFIKPYDNELTDFLKFPKYKYPQTGLISYFHIKKNYLNNKIYKVYLVGFTNDYKGKIWSGHCKKTEQSFLDNEVIIYNNVIKINK